MKPLIYGIYFCPQFFQMCRRSRECLAKEKIVSTFFFVFYCITWWNKMSHNHESLWHVNSIVNNVKHGNMPCSKFGRSVWKHIVLIYAFIIPNVIFSSVLLTINCITVMLRTQLLLRGKGKMFVIILTGLFQISDV